MDQSQTKTAVILFNLGGPDTLDAVQPFLQNLFSDPAIIGLPGFLRLPLAKFIAAKRAAKAQHIYEQIGGKSPILENTQAQADALEAALNEDSKKQTKIFIAMRYWHPRADAVAKAVKAWGAERVILLPLYPQFSTTTTGSSFEEWDSAARREGLNVPTAKICCYPSEAHFIASHVAIIKPIYEAAAKHGRPRVLFSAHGLPEKIIRKGDPYQAQVEATTQAVLKAMGIQDLDYVNCYQSRVGPLKWIGPSTEEEIKKTAVLGAPLVLVPIAFVSEHSETLVELDMEYAELAHENGVAHYFRVPTISAHAEYIASLAALCRAAEDGKTKPVGSGMCEKNWKQCPCKEAR